MINGSYKNGLALTLQKRTVDNLFMLCPFSTLKQLTESFDTFSTMYKDAIPALIFSTDKDCKVTNEKLTELSALAGAVCKFAMTAHVDEINKGSKRRNVIESLMLAKEHLTKLRELINAAKTK